MIEIVPRTGSTSSDLAARLARGENVSEADWLVADRQTAGRGRSGRGWQDGAGNFMGSTVVHLREGDPSPPTLALVAGLSLHDLLAPKANAPLFLKWPNDILANDAKLAGILLERVGQAVIVGVGVNLVVAPSVEDRRTVSVAELGLDPSRDAFAEELARQFATDLERWRSYGLGPVLSRWIAAGHPEGTRLAVEGSDGSRVEGQFAGLTGEGALQLRLADGRMRVIHAGETRIV